jgi:putative ABC transport system ATP-binding protein
MVRLAALSKKFVKGKETISIFDQLDIAIARGDFVAVMGPSGSGKTTLLNLLGGIDHADSGEIHVAGQRIDALSEGELARFRAANVGFIFQFYNLMPMLTAAQNVELPLLLTRLRGKERAKRVETALAVVNLADRMKHYPREMSGGQQQRVAIARSIVSDPNLLLCDEPTGDLDRTSADEILSILQLLNKDLGKTIVMVTHDPAAARYARRTWHLDKGRFVEKDLAHESIWPHKPGPCRMNDFVLVRKNLFRKKLRAGLMIVSIFVAFLIFGMLASFYRAFTVGEEVAAADRLVVVNKINFTQPLPIAYFNRVKAMEGVRQVAHLNWFGGYYQEPKNFLDRVRGRAAELHGRVRGRSRYRAGGAPGLPARAHRHAGRRGAGAQMGLEGRRPPCRSRATSFRRRTARAPGT